MRYSWILFLLLLCSCSDEKVPLVGRREYLLPERLPALTKKQQGAHFSIPPATIISSWQQPGYNAAHILPSIVGPKDFRKDWETSLSYGEDRTWKISADPLLADNRLFVLDAGGILFALQTETGAILWKTSLTPCGCEGNLNGGMAYADGILYIATTFSEIIACEGATGRLLWRRALESPAAGGLTIAEGRLFVVLSNNTVEVRNLKTGAPLWTHKGLIEDAKMIGNAACAVDQGVVLVPYASGELFALHAETGSVLWEYNLTKIASSEVLRLFPHIRALPVLFEGTAYALGYSGLMVAIDLRTGKKRWEYEIGGTEPPCVTKSGLALISTEGSCVCFGQEGQVLWSTVLPESEGRFPALWRGPFLINGQLMASHSDGTFVFLSPEDGHILRQILLEDPVVVRPLIAQRKLFIVTQNGRVQAYR
ncbi:MAG: PQQ-binding-like beta-propeller repeat protein [Holosporales bacterium]|jgi:outer membrane protein assembly factor BamB|nr:PQQ-binding-like beta-propeller repeat protein [Holosporales bacterium]